MLHSISWQEYCFCLLILLVIYYGTTWFIYWKTGTPFLTRLRKYSRKTNEARDDHAEALATAQHVIEELRPLFADRYNRGELLYALQSNLKKYNGWEEPEFRNPINEFIADESRKKCSIRLSGEDLRMIWKGQDGAPK